ncbi:hypothetical protein [Succinimonas sp.]|uniref:hypothetical protein n=1 Tax=Succinimonas sp. TaxID=1936151 RepID=UPI00386CE286
MAAITRITPVFQGVVKQKEAAVLAVSFFSPSPVLSVASISLQACKPAALLLRNSFFEKAPFFFSLQLHLHFFLLPIPLLFVPEVLVFSVFLTGSRGKSPYKNLLSSCFIKLP